jgi:hypothetical protein
MKNFAAALWCYERFVDIIFGDLSEFSVARKVLNQQRQRIVA